MFGWFIRWNWQIHSISPPHLQSSPHAAPPPIAGGSGADHGTMELRRSSPIVIDVTPSVLRPKPTTKSCHEHCVYVIMHMIEGVDKFLVA